MTHLANGVGTCGTTPPVERLVLAEQVTIALAGLATAVRDGLVKSDAEGGRMMALARDGAEGFEPLTPCMPCSFGLLPTPGQRRCAQPIGLLHVTVSVRWLPLVTAACGTWVAAAGGNDVARTCRRRLPARGSVWLSAGDDDLVGKPRSGAAASGRPDHGQSSRLLSCPRWAPATTTPGSDNRERRGDQPSQRSLIFRGATGPDRHSLPYARRRATSIRATHLYIILSTNYQSARFKG